MQYRNACGRRVIENLMIMMAESGRCMHGRMGDRWCHSWEELGATRERRQARRREQSGFKHRFRRDAYATQMRRNIEVLLDPTQPLRARRQLRRDVGATQIGV